MLTTFKTATSGALAEVAEEMRVRQTKEAFLFFVLGSQFDHLIKQMLENIGVFCLVADPATVTVDDVRRLNPIGIILSGGPASAHSEPPPFDRKIFDLGIPILGICLGYQMAAKHLGFKLVLADRREFGRYPFMLSEAGRQSPLFKGAPSRFQVLQSHGDCIEIPMGPDILGSTENSPVSAGHHGHIWGVQFHPETTATEGGRQIFENFCFDICGAKDRFPASSIAERKIQEIREVVGNQKVQIALSGGADSCSTAWLIKKALEGQKGRIRAVYIKGVDRPDDEAYVRQYFGNEDWIGLIVVDATGEFLAALAGKTSMREKRLAMRGVYKRILEGEARKWGGGESVFIAQGTLYTDISESGGGYDAGARKAKIKHHHNIVDFEAPFHKLEPLADCVKDGGRNIGRSIGVPEELLIRHPFPGPGLIVRILGEITHEKLAIARLLDKIYIEELRKWGLYHTVWQAGVVLTDSRSAYTKGDDAGDGLVASISAVWSVNGFTAEWADLPSDFLRHVSNRMTNEVPGIARVVHDITSKPPGTIEWG